LRRPWVLDLGAGVVAAFGLVDQWIIMHANNWAGTFSPDTMQFLIQIDKEGLHPFRLISILALMWLSVRLIPAHAQWLRSRFAAPFIVCGQHSLPVFCVGIFLSFLGRIAFEQNDGWLMQGAVNAAGAVVLMMVGAMSAWYAAKGRGRSEAVSGGGH
jgi:hypothetical protein